MRPVWTIEKIREGFEFFRKEFGRLPLAPEIDELPYLPSSRYIQLRLGGLSKLRKELGYEDNHFGRGKHRSSIANRINSRGRNTELSLEKILVKKFGKVFVHTEKIFDASKNRVDFYVFSPDGNFGIDVFSTERMQYFQSIINIKMEKYRNFPLELFLVVANEKFNQEDLDRYREAKTKRLPKNMRLATLNTLLGFLDSKSSYPNLLT